MIAKFSEPSGLLEVKSLTVHVEFQIFLLDGVDRYRITQHVALSLGKNPANKDYYVNVCKNPLIW